MKKLTAVSLFSGTGGFDWGAKNAGVEIIWANDIDQHAASAYKSLFPKVDFVLDSIENITEFPQADILIGCYPCTGFSVGARRRGKNQASRDLTKNKTNFLYQEFLRALDEVQPKYLFVENVRGMASANGGWFLEEQLRGFRSRGYTVQYPQVLTATHFGVPQSRQRIFIVGVKNEEGALDYKYPKETHGPSTSKSFIDMETAIGHLPEWPVGDFFDYKFHGHYLTRNRKRRWDQPSYTIVAKANHIPLHPIGEPMKYIEKDTWELQGKYNRRLSWRECAVLQGLPQSCEPSGSIRDKYRVIGNAVPPKLAEELIKPIVKFERKKSENKVSQK